jgi:hypothetical protein
MHFYINGNHKSLESINNIFAAQEFIQQEIRNDQTNIKKIIFLSKEKNPKESWILENFRQFLIELNSFIIFHNDVCTKDTQPEMRIKIPGVG